MPKADFISPKSELAELADKLHTIAAALSGFQPALRLLTDSSHVDGDGGNALELIGAAADYLNDDLCAIASRLNALGREAA